MRYLPVASFVDGQVHVMRQVVTNATPQKPLNIPLFEFRLARSRMEMSHRV